MKLNEAQANFISNVKSTRNTQPWTTQHATVSTEVTSYDRSKTMQNALFTQQATIREVEQAPVETREQRPDRLRSRRVSAVVVEVPAMFEAASTPMTNCERLSVASSVYISSVSQELASRAHEDRHLTRTCADTVRTGRLVVRSVVHHESHDDGRGPPTDETVGCTIRRRTVFRLKYKTSMHS